MKVVYPVFVPRRDYRFEYAEDALEFIEDNFCSKGCKFACGDLEFPSSGCYTLPENICFEIPVPTIVDADVRGLICKAYEGYNNVV